MKKIIFTIGFILLLSAGCNRNEQSKNVSVAPALLKPEATTTQPTTSRTLTPARSECAYFNVHGISFSCPSDFYIQDYTDAMGNTQLTVFNKNKIYNIEESSTYAVYIGIFKDTYGSSIDNFLKKDPQSELDKQSTLGGVTSYILKCKPNAYYCQKQEVSFVNGKVYQFINSSEFADETLPVYNSILASVQFVE